MISIMKIPLLIMLVGALAVAAIKDRKINCHGSTHCIDPCMPKLDQLESFILDAIPDDAIFSDREKIACYRPFDDSKCHTVFKDHEEALCAWPRKMPEGRTVSGAVIKAKIRELRFNGCNVCGSVPLHGNDVQKGMITVNHVDNGCVGGKPWKWNDPDTSGVGVCYYPMSNVYETYPGYKNESYVALPLEA